MRGRGTWNRTTISGFGDPHTNRCTIPLYMSEKGAVSIDISILFVEHVWVIVPFYDTS